MTIDITETPRREQFVISGTGPYSCAFEILDEEDVAVYRDATLLTYITHYTVSISETGAFSITLLSATGTTLTVIGARPYERLSDFQTGGDFKAATVDRELDSLEIQIQQLVEEHSRTLRVSPTSEDLPTPLPSAEEGKFIMWGPDGELMNSAGTGADAGLRTDLANSDLGSTLVAAHDTLAPAYLKTLSDILNGSEVNVLRFIDRTWHAGIRAFTFENDVSDNLREAVAALSNISSSQRGGRLYLPYGGYAASDYETDAAGNYVVNVGQRVHIRGDGKRSTEFKFNPAATASLFRFKEGSAICYQSSLRGVGFTGDGAQKKTAVELYDTSEVTVEDFAIYPWTGANSRGVWLRGREITRIDDFSISADQPIHISANPNHSIACDHLTVGNGQILTQVTTNHAMLIDSGAHVTNLLWRGQTAVNLGAGILKWADAASAIVHANVKLQNIRCEQSTTGTSYMVDIQPNLGIQNLELSNIYGGLGINGFRLHGFQNVRMIGTEYIDTAKIGLEASGVAGSSISMVGCFWQEGATASLTDLHKRWAIRDTSANRNLPSTGVYYATSGNNRDAVEINGLPFRSYQGTIAQAASVDLALGSSAGVKCALLNISANGATKRACGVVAISLIGGAELLSSSGDLTVDAAAVDAGKLTVVCNGANVLLANDTGESLRYLIDARFVE